jgi:hypothetical protein
VAQAKALRLKIGETLAVTIGVNGAAKNKAWVNAAIAAAPGAGRAFLAKLQSFMKTMP